MDSERLLKLADKFAVRVSIQADEIYPSLEPVMPGEQGSREDLAVEVPDELVNRWHQAHNEFRKVNEEMKPFKEKQKELFYAREGSGATMDEEDYMSMQEHEEDAAQ